MLSVMVIEESRKFVSDYLSKDLGDYLKLEITYQNGKLTYNAIKEEPTIQLVSFKSKRRYRNETI